MSLSDSNENDGMSGDSLEHSDEPRDGNGEEAGVFVRVAAIVLVLLAGVGSLMGLSMLKKPPAEANVTERSRLVTAIRVEPEDVSVNVTGLGEVHALNVIPISPEVPGTIVEIYPNLEMGETIPKGALLFKIDQRDYLAAKAQAESQVAQIDKTIERIKRQSSIDESRLKTLERSERLMQSDFDRTCELFEKDDVGTRSAVDHAEMSLNQAADAHDQLAQALALYPVQIQEAASGLDGARAQLEMAEANLARTEVRAPFDARIKQVGLEKGQYVTPGTSVLTLADDQVLEISVSLDSRDAKNWLQFDLAENTASSAWFGQLKPVSCRVSWTEDPEHHSWEGTIHRVEKFDQKNRTLNVAIRIQGEDARRSTGGLPLVEGMFCSVSIPGKAMKQVYRLPRWAVTYEGNAYVIRDGRLAIQHVDVVRSEGEETFVQSGLNPGDQVITTRLTNPLPNQLVRVDVPQENDA